MKFNKGFTLAEVLIALVIVGILAALTVPSLMNNVAKQQAATGVMRAYNTLQNANKLLLSQANTPKISAACIDKDDYLECLKPHVNYEKTDLGDTVYHAKYLGTDNENKYSEKIGSGCAYGGSDNIVYMMYLTDISDTGVRKTSDSSYIGKYYYIYVDVNGVNKAPNTYGRDIFAFRVDDGGAVIPIGGNIERVYMADNVGTSWKSGCPNDSMPANSTNGPLTCTGAIIDNGGRILYKY